MKTNVNTVKSMCFQEVKTYKWPKNNELYVNSFNTLELFNL